VSRSRTIDAAPLIVRVEAADSAPTTRATPRLARAWHRAVSDGHVTLGMADELAVGLLGMHPANVWGDE